MFFWFIEYLVVSYLHRTPVYLIVGIHLFCFASIGGRRWFGGSAEQPKEEYWNKYIDLCALVLRTSRKLQFIFIFVYCGMAIDYSLELHTPNEYMANGPILHISTDADFHFNKFSSFNQVGRRLFRTTPSVWVCVRVSGRMVIQFNLEK